MKKILISYKALANNVAAAYLVGLCFEARNLAHKFHLATTSYAQHKALEEYYNGIIELADSYAENYQGRHDLLTNYPQITLTAATPIELVEEVRNWIDANRQDCGDFSELQNIIDDIQALNNSTLYKLRNLK